MSAGAGKISCQVSAGCPNETLRVCMDGRVTNWERVNTIVERLRDPTYNLKQYHDDCTSAFHELDLYRCEAGANDPPLLPSQKIANEQEYQRTIGALYAIYWLIRIDIGGKEGFCFGFDGSTDDWRPKEIPAHIDLENQPSLSFHEMNEWQKRTNAYVNVLWEKFTELFLQAKLLTRACDTEQGVRVGNATNRMRTMICFTAIHDVFKNPAILPRVQEECAPFQGFEAGEVIQNHDAALAYILEHHMELLPAASGLDEEGIQLLIFTQSKMAFNNGWLVQGEAPPGPLFTVFKDLILKGQADSSDIAFYLCHWITDLAGSYPNPQGGGEKFCVQLPTSVRASFLTSFPFIWELSAKTETEVTEEYLRFRITEGDANAFGGDSEDLYESEDFVCLSRLILQAQVVHASALPALPSASMVAPSNAEQTSTQPQTTHQTGHTAASLSDTATPPGPVDQASILCPDNGIKQGCQRTGKINIKNHEIRISRDSCAMALSPDVVTVAFGLLNCEDRQILREEMSCTGIRGQSFSCTGHLKIIQDVGPAFLIYYGPAWMQTNAAKSPLPSLLVLTEIYRTSRKMWPFRPIPADVKADFVTVSIVEIKGVLVQELLEMQDSADFILFKKNTLEGSVEKYDEDRHGQTDYLKLHFKAAY